MTEGYKFFDNQQIEVILQALKSHGAADLCASCGHDQLVLQDGYTMLQSTPDFRQTRVSNIGIPCVVVVCERCGLVHTYALGTLGILGSSVAYLEEKASDAQR